MLNQLGEVELALAELMGEFNTGEDNSGMVKAFEAKHRPDPLFHPPVILLNDVVQIRIRAEFNVTGSVPSTFSSSTAWRIFSCVSG